MAVKVYFEGTGSAEGVAIFDDEEGYDACYAKLEKLAKKHHWDIVTESIQDGVDMNHLFDLADLLEECNNEIIDLGEEIGFDNIPKDALMKEFTLKLAKKYIPEQLIK